MVGTASNGTRFISNFMKIGPMVQLEMEGHTQHGDLISLLFPSIIKVNTKHIFGFLQYSETDT
jgi:hypothetical protein